MTDEQDVVRWLFELMVNHLERTDEKERAIHRLEVTDQGLEVVAKNGALYRVTVQRIGSPSEGKGEREMKAENTSNEVIQVSISDWNALVEACEAALNFLDYDQRKMRELRLQFPDFPWEKRAQMIKRISDQLRAAIDKIEGDMFEEVEETE
ncbi:hypothetical protein CLV97_12251 [Planifilum fimeticola]|jgi:hypothetical protein|uniref:Uncharacterized protein n=1 Tax=Planifilum fimeticola TaxID=201975 RepID=A0A2T0LCC6_9BACL|nr:hypothetical protein [Planifilum fimeticola]PRX39649.1 hypothetical protein CLV97_12251 [Planifilum fimeticola]